VGRPVTSDLRLLLRELHVVEDAEDDPEEVVPPVLLEGEAVALHDLEHDREPSGRQAGQGSGWFWSASVERIYPKRTTR